MSIPPGTEVLLVITTEHTMNQAHVAAPRPTRPHPPDPGQKAKRASQGPTAQLKSSTQPPAPRNSLWDDLNPAPTLDPCPVRVLALGPGLDASPEVTDWSSKALYLSVPEDVSVQLSTYNQSVKLYICICFSSHYGRICCQSKEQSQELR